MHKMVEMQTQTQSLPKQVNLQLDDDAESFEKVSSGIVEAGEAINGNHRDRSESSSVSPRNTTSTSSWETTMISLMRELENICSRTSSPNESVDSLTATATPCSTPTGERTEGGIASLQSSMNSRRTCSVAIASDHRLLPHQGSLNDRCLPPPPPLIAGAQQLRVRHEETEDQLDRSLTMICHMSSPSNSTWNCNDGGPASAMIRPLTGSGEDSRERKQSMPTKNNSKLTYRDSAKYGLRFRLDLVDRNPDDITVSMNTDEHILRVFAAGEVIHLLQLTENTTPETMTCLIVDEGRTLYVRQRSKETMYLEHDGSPEVNLPIVRHDESKLTMTINLRIPPTFSPDDIVVKTVDETLLIKAGSGSTAASSQDERSSLCGGVHFRLAMNLPDGTVTRSVCAWMVTGHLIVRGNVGQTSRRMTCNF